MKKKLLCFLFILCCLNGKCAVVDTISVPLVEFSSDKLFLFVDSLFNMPKNDYYKKFTHENTYIYFDVDAFPMNTCAYGNLSDEERKEALLVMVSFAPAYYLNNFKFSMEVKGYLHYRGYLVVICGSMADKVILPIDDADDKTLRVLVYDDFSLGDIIWNRVLWGRIRYHKSQLK